jgi:hypothetical protein
VRSGRDPVAPSACAPDHVGAAAYHGWHAGRGALEGAPLATWHPILAADEPEPGRWRLVDSMGREYGRVTIVRVDGEVRYRAEFQGRLLGWGSSLRGACERVHHAFVRSHGPGEWQGYPDFSHARS